MLKRISNLNYMVMLSIIISFMCSTAAYCEMKQTYEPNWESLSRFEVPQWYADAKLGIFIHWGVYSVPAAGSEWYPRNMYFPDSRIFKHHRKHWGDQKEFGYKDFIPMFKAEKWDPDDWADLFVKSGARYVLPVAEHHDGFAMYDTQYSKYNAARMGPKRDVIGELAAALRKHDLKLGLSSHRAFNWRYYNHDGDFDTNDPDNAGLYGRPHGPHEPASQEFLTDWWNRTTEMIDKYQPDQLWFDFVSNSPEYETYRKKIVAYYYNKGIEWNKPVVLNNKYEGCPEGTVVLDIERGKLNDIHHTTWQSHTIISKHSWGYIKDDEFKSTSQLIHDFVDVVSKNGVFLLNIGPRADGTIPQPARDVLLEVGQWLEINGEAIYASRPWIVFREGPNRLRTGGAFTDDDAIDFTGQDIRFTMKGNVLYAIAMAWPGEEILIQSLGTSKQPHTEVLKAEMLGYDQPLKFQHEEEALVIECPGEQPCQHAYVFKITLGGWGCGGLNYSRLSADSYECSAILMNYEKTSQNVNLRFYQNDTIKDSVNCELNPHAKMTFNKILSGDNIDKSTFTIGTKISRLPSRRLRPLAFPLENPWKFKSGDNKQWKNPDYDDHQWQKVTLPTTWEQHSNYTIDPAYGWYRKTITIPENWKGHHLAITLGKIDDIDQTFFNGECIGALDHGTLMEDSSFEASRYTDTRRYVIEPDLIHYGRENTIAIRVLDAYGQGGIYAGPLKIEIAEEFWEDNN